MDTISQELEVLKKWRWVGGVGSNYNINKCARWSSWQRAGSSRNFAQLMTEDTT